MSSETKESDGLLGAVLLQDFREALTQEQLKELDRVRAALCGCGVSTSMLPQNAEGR